MRAMRSVLVLGICLMVPWIAFATGQAEEEGDETVNLRLYTQYTDETETIPTDYAIEQLKDEMPNVEVEIEVRARDDNQKIKTYAAAGALPDIFDANADIIETFRKSNNILPLNPYVEELGIESRLSPAMQKLLYHEDGNIYAVPNVGAWVAVMFYNKTLFDEYDVDVPTNYEELLEAVRVFSENDVIPLSLFAKEKWPGVQLFDVIATRYAPEGVVALDKGNALMSDEPYRRAAEQLVDLVDAGLIVPGAFSTGYDQAYAQFVEGRAAMLLNGAWAMSTLYEDMGDDVAMFDWYPVVPEGRERATRWNMSGGAWPGGFAVSPYSENKDVAARYAIQLSLAYAEGGTVKLGFPPVTKDSPEPEEGYNPVQRDFWSDAGNIETTTTFPWGLEDAQFKTAIEDNVQKLMAGTMTVDSFVTAMDRAIQAD